MSRFPWDARDGGRLERREIENHESADQRQAHDAYSSSALAFGHTCAFRSSYQPARGARALA
jgi:hypothetical protein